MTIYEAVSAASASDTILLKAGTYTPSANIAVSAPISFVGGLAGTDDSTLDAVSPMSVFDANEDTSVTAIFSVTTATGGNTTNLFSRIEFRNGYQRGFYKTGNASLAFRDCAFTANGRNSNVTTSSGNNGRGGYFEGNFSAATLSFERCTFARNAYAGSAKSVGYGFGAYIKSWKRVFIDDSLFVSNGLAGTRVNGQWRAQDGNWGAAFYADSAPVTVVGTEFRANIAGTGGNANRGGIAFIVGNCTGGCFFRNCIFAGNACQYCHDAGTTTSSSCGPLVFASGNKDYTLDVENCTFAYNFIDGTYGTAGIDAFRGAVRVRDSIFYGAQSGNYRLCGKDIHVYGDATADVDYCLFDEDSSDSVSAAMPNLLSMGEHNSFGDPLFATPLSAITPYRTFPERTTK